MSTCSTCQPLRLNRSPDYPMTHNARPALSKPSAAALRPTAPIPPPPPPGHPPLVPLPPPPPSLPLARQLAAGMQRREAISFLAWTDAAACVHEKSSATYLTPCLNRLTRGSQEPETRAEQSLPLSELSPARGTRPCATDRRNFAPTLPTYCSEA
ncbi:hypothetical protein PUN28_013284 [Cardiocondyla obscurior]|uniref:Uncharacterized protein n=1 Tax=Cardiocondyla obscurior TaxID=286306 RepID=A0AAW2FA80_9HYME